MYAIIEIKGSQLRVKENEIYSVPRIKSQEGEIVKIDKVLLISDGKETITGNPYIEGAEVRARVIGERKLKKITVFKMKSKKNYRVKKGHRQTVTEIQIEKIKK